MLLSSLLMALQLLACTQYVVLFTVSWRHCFHQQTSFKLCSMSTDYFTSCCCSILQVSCYRVIKVTKARQVTRINFPFTKMHTRKEVVRNPGQVCCPHSLCISSIYKVVGANSHAGDDPCFWLRHCTFKRNSTLEIISAPVFCCSW